MIQPPGTRASLTRVSANAKTGPIPVSITEAASCPPTCPLVDRGCYARAFPLGLHWQRVEESGLPWADFVAEVKTLHRGQLWRHNQAGDLPGDGNEIDREALDALVTVNELRDLRGFTYTHYPIGATRARKRNLAAIRHANARGFTINISTDNAAEAREIRKCYPDLPVVTILPVDARRANTDTIVICPNHLDKEITCGKCELCASADRDFVVGFPAHGRDKRETERRTQWKS